MHRNSTMTHAQFYSPNLITENYQNYPNYCACYLYQPLAVIAITIMTVLF